jgi:adenylate cyclase
MTIQKKINNFIVYSILAFIISLFGIAIYIFTPVIMQTLNGIVQDYMFSVRGNIKTNNKIVIVDIDEKSLKSIGQWPWSRNDISQILTNLTKANVNSIGLDIVFAEKDKTSPYKIFMDYNKSINGIPDYDEILAYTITNTPTILGYQFKFEDDNYLNFNAPHIPAIIIEKNKPKNKNLILKAKGVLLNIPIIQNNAYSSGFFNNIADDSGMIRSVPLIIDYNNQMYPSLPLELIRVFKKSNKLLINYNEFGVENIIIDDLIIPTDKKGRLTVNFRGGVKSFKYISAVDILNNNFQYEDFDNKIVLIGTSATGIFDLKATPFSNTFPGVEVHANVIDNILQQDFITKPLKVDTINILIIFIVTFLSIYLLAYSTLWFNPFILIIMIGILYKFNYYMLFTKGMILDTIIPTLSIFISVIMATFLKYFFKIKNEKMIKEKFANKVSKDVMNDLLNNNESKFKTINREVTIFFSDIRNFTNISETIQEPEMLIEFMNQYMEPMTKIIMNNNGTVDKYIGDAIMAYWNAPSIINNHADKALKSALEQLYKLQELNIIIKTNPIFANVVHMSSKLGQEPLDIGIGLNTGEVVIGEMGSSIRSDYTIIGDAVNLGSRLESLCKYYDSKCNISNFTKNKLQGDYIFRYLDLVKVKGKQEAVEIWQVIDYDNKDESLKLYSVSKLDLEYELSLYNQAIQMYKNKNFTIALQTFKECNNIENKTNKNIYNIYIKRCEYYISNPSDNFDGVFEHTIK